MLTVSERDTNQFLYLTDYHPPPLLKSKNVGQRKNTTSTDPPALPKTVSVHYLLWVIKNSSKPTQSLTLLLVFKMELEKAEWWRRHPNEMKRDRLSNLTVEIRFLVKKNQ